MFSFSLLEQLSQEVKASMTIKFYISDAEKKNGAVLPEQCPLAFSIEGAPLILHLRK